MNDPIDIKTKKIFYDKGEATFNKTLVYEKLQHEIFKSWQYWTKFQQQWCNNAFGTFKDYDKYLLLIYLFRQVMQSYADKFQFFSLQEFYSTKEFVIDKINLIQISEDLKIPKETVRRKINEFQNTNILRREGKQIIFKKLASQHQIPLQSLELLSIFIQKQITILQDNNLFENTTKEQIKSYFEKYYTVFWLRFFKLQIPFLIKWREVFQDLETWNVWGIIALNHLNVLNRSHEQNIYKQDSQIDVGNFYTKITKAEVSHGVNASSISDISKIPRATVIRKLRWLQNKELIKKNESLEYMMKPKGRKNIEINEVFLKNRENVCIFVTDILDLIKSSNFKI